MTIESLQVGQLLRFILKSEIEYLLDYAEN